MTTEQFKLAYFEKIEGLKKQIADMKAHLKELLVWTQIVAIFLMVPSIIAILAGIDQERISIDGVTLLFSVIPIFVVIYLKLVADDRVNEFLKIDTTRFTKVDWKEINDLKAIIEDLTDSMGIEQHNINVWKSRSNTYLPSIQSDLDNVHHLILPLNFFFLLLHDKAAAKALIAHEFGHILQDDTNSWLFILTNSKIIQRGILPLAVFFIAMAVFNYVLAIFGGGLAVSGLGISAVILYGGYGIVVRARQSLKKMKLYRRQSEILADWASIIYADGHALISGLKQYATDSKSNIHPAVSSRTELVARALATIS